MTPSIVPIGTNLKKLLPGLKSLEKILKTSVNMQEKIPTMLPDEWKSLFGNGNNIWKWLSMADGTMSKKLYNHPNNTGIITEEKDPGVEDLVKNEDDHPLNGNVVSRKQKILSCRLEEEKEEDLDSMPYKETCNLCKGNGYITIVVEGNDEIKQCWLCESKGEKEYSQAEVDKLIYETYYKK